MLAGHGEDRAARWRRSAVERSSCPRCRGVRGRLAITRSTKASRRVVLAPQGFAPAGRSEVENAAAWLEEGD